MTTAFILRFQEECMSDDTDDISASTMTTTKINSEQPDAAPPHASYSALLAGTATITRVATEQGDRDRASGSTIIPRRMLEMGTKTMTAIRAEISDSDPGRIQHRILPRCS